MVRRRVDLLILDSKETVTVSDDLGPDDVGVIDGGGVAVDNGRIVEVASTQLIEKKYRGRNVVRATDEIVLPGFVDPHTHLVFKGSREEEFGLRVRGLPYMEVLRKGGGILETVNRTRQTSTESLLKASRERLNKALETGTTSIEMKSGYGLRLQDEVKMLRVINILKKEHPCRVTATFLGAHALPTEYSSPEIYTRLIIEEMLPVVMHEKLARFCDVFCERGVFDERLSMRILKAGRHYGLRPKVHADEFSDSGGARVANMTRAVSADHLIHSPSSQLEQMRETGVTPVLLPASSHSLLMEQHADATEMLSMNLPVALGTDFSPANWILGPLNVAALAARELKMRSGDIIRGITINAARALGLERRIGALTPGRLADIAVIRAPSHKWIGYAGGEGLVDKVLIGGELMVDDGRRVR